MTMQKMKVVMFAAAVLFVQFADALTFTADSTEIAIPTNAVGPVRLAAKEMKEFLSRVFGAPVPIVNRVSPAKSTIILGTNGWSKAVGIDRSTLRCDGYLHKTLGNALYIAGADSDLTIDHCVTSRFFDRGTLMGTYAFLEKYAGCRFYFPGELGEVVPQRDAITIPEIDFRDAPAMAERKYAYHDSGEWFDETCRDNQVKVLKNRNILRLRLASRNYITSHGLRYFDYAGRFAKSHPEYFVMQKNGSRIQLKDDAPLHIKGLLCFSNPDFRETVYQDIRAYLAKQSPESRGLKRWDGRAMWCYKYVGVQPEDVWRPCQCERCKAIYRHDLGNSFATDLIWGFTKEIAERLMAEGFDAVLMQSSYSAWVEPPDFGLPPNLAIDIDTTGPWAARKPDAMKRDLAMLEKWTKKLGHAVFNWTYPGKFGSLFGYQNLKFPGVPQITPRAWGAYYKAAAPYLSGEFAGTYAETYTDRFLFDALNVYVFSRVAWDPSVDVDAILDEHYRLMYGAAAKDIQSLFEEMEDIWLDRIYGETVWTNVGPVTRVPSAFQLWTEIYTPAKIAELLEIVDRAAAKVAPGSVEARRIALVRTEILGHLARNSREYVKGLSVEREKAARAARNPINLVKDFKPVVITVDGTMTNRHFHRVKHPVPQMRQGHRYRVSCFFKGENIRLYPWARLGGMQVTPWGDESADLGWSFPKPGLTGTFGWSHFSTEVTIPEKIKNFRPEVDLRMFRATGTAHFDGLLVEEIE